MPIILKNPLFLGLLIAGVVLVIAVIIYNILQERRLRRRKDAALRKSGDDAPLRPGQERVEPKLGGEKEAVVSKTLGQSVAIETAAAIPRDLNERVGFFDSSLSQTFGDSVDRSNGVMPSPSVLPLLKAFNSSMTCRTSGLGGVVTAGTSRATGLPCLVMVNSSPWATRSRSWGRWVFASNEPTDSMNILL